MERSARPRKVASKIITHAALEHQRVRLFGLIRSLAARLSNLDTEKDRSRAEQILLDAQEKAGLAALAWLSEFNVPIYKACIDSAMNFAKMSLFAGEAEFKFLSPKALNTKSRNFALGPIIEMYSAIRSDLKIFWKQKIQPNRLMGRSHYASNKGQYGPAQKQGTWKRTAQNEARAAAVRDTVKRYVEEEGREFFGMPEITEHLAKQWVQKLKTPNQIAMQILAHFTDMKIRTIKALLNKARRLSKSPF